MENEEDKSFVKKKLGKVASQLASRGIDSVLLLIPFIGWILLGIKKEIGTTGLIFVITFPCCCCIVMVLALHSVATTKDLGQQIKIGASLIESGCAGDGLGLITNMQASSTDFGTCLVKDVVQGEDSVLLKRNFSKLDE